jgi:6,7-dimethyl-8-ribityllumazine synthase
MSTLDAPLPAAPRVPGPAPHVLMVRAPYYRDVIDGMTRGAERILRDAGATHEVLDVAGAFELPQAIRLALRGNRRFDGFVALGCVVKGETDHYEFLCREAMAGLMNVALQYGIALGSGLLTVHDIGQAVARSSDDGHNKGAEAAAAALLQVAAARELGAA